MNYLSRISVWLQLKVWYKVIQNRLKVRRAMATEAKISGPADDKRPDFFQKCADLKQPYCFIKVHRSVKFRVIERDTTILLSY